MIEHKIEKEKELLKNLSISNRQSGGKPYTLQYKIEIKNVWNP